jgi:hypothetical protein
MVHLRKFRKGGAFRRFHLTIEIFIPRAHNIDGSSALIVSRNRCLRLVYQLKEREAGSRCPGMAGLAA